MRLLDIQGRLIYKNVQCYLIDWNEKSRSKLQFVIKQFFKPFWQHYVCYEEFPVFGSRMKIDILNASKRIAVEVQGEQHTQFSKYFHHHRMDFLLSMQRDARKIEWLEKNNFKFLELVEDDLEKLSPKYIIDKFGVSII